MSGEIAAVLPANDPIDLMAFLLFIIQITICLCNFLSLINEHFYPVTKIVPVIMKCSSGNKVTIHYTWLIYKNSTTHFKVELTLWNRGPAMTERAKATRCCCPPLNSLGNRFSIPDRRTNSSASFAAASWSKRSPLRRTRSGKRRFSITVIWGNNE